MVAPASTVRARVRLRRRACRTGRALLTRAGSLPVTLGVDVVMAEREARGDVNIREVVVPCERMEGRCETVVVVDWTEVRAEGGRERGGGGYG